PYLPYTLRLSAHSPFFILSCYVHPPHLHSFPTRRSSDLGPEYPPGGARALPPLPAGPDLCPKHRGRLLPVLRPHLDPRPHLPGEDRKSTRLNSSHVSISYAVFCLKKKIQQKPLRQQRITV